MNWEVIKTEAEYKKAVKRMMVIFHAEQATPEAEELAQLLELIKDYEDKHIQVSGLAG
jgi:HTH-type transcriptional regulator / antitoxin HigA